MKENQNVYIPDQRARLLEIMDKIQDENNPVLILSYLRKNNHHALGKRGK